jgi:hypothetical protein
MPAKKRETFSGSAQEITDVLMAFATQAKFFDFDIEASNERQKAQVEKDSKLYVALKALSANMSFQPTKMDKAFELVWDACLETWAPRLRDDHKANYCEKMSLGIEFHDLILSSTGYLKCELMSDGIRECQRISNNFK